MPSMTEFKHPIFNLYSINEIAEKSLCSLAYVVEMANGTRPVTKRFIRICSLSFQRPEADLFNLDELGNSSR